MSTGFEIPLAPAPQKITIALGGVTYRLALVWNGTSACWVLDIYSADSVAILLGVPLVTGVDLLAQYEYLGFGGQLIVQSDPDPDVVPSFTTLGTTGHLYWVQP